MPTTRTLPIRCLFGSTAIALSLVLTGCSEDDPASRDEGSAPAGTSSAGAEPRPLPITAHVLGPQELPGFEAGGAPEPQDVKSFAEEHEKSVAELRRSGFRSGASVFFEGADQEGFALSVAVEYVDSEAAEAEADRLFASNTEGDPAVRTRPLDLPGVDGVRAASLHGTEGGRRLTGVEIVFVDGAVMHEVFAVGEAASFDIDGAVAAVTALHDKVADRPVA